MSGRLEPQVERAVSTQYYRALVRVEVEATEQLDVQRHLEAGKFGTDSARRMLGLAVGVSGVVIGVVAAAVVLASLHWALLPMLLAIALPKGWGPCGPPDANTSRDCTGSTTAGQWPACCST